MRAEHVRSWLDDAESGTPSLTRRGVLAGAGALALVLVGGIAESRPVLAQDDSTPEAGVEAEVEGGIQVGTTDDAAGDTQAEGEAEVAAGTELPADDAATDDQTREERRAARDDEAGVGGTVTAAPSTGVGALGASLGGVIGAIGLAAASVGAAIYTRRGASSPEDSES